MRNLLPLASACLNRPAAPFVFASDAEGANNHDLGGYGIVGASAPDHLCEEVLLTGHIKGRTVAKLNGDVSKHYSGEKELARTVAVSRVLRSLLESRGLEWQPIAWGRWKHKEHIMLGEARATLELLERLAAFEQTRGFAVACLVDNESWTAAVAKGRSPNFFVNLLLRRRAALLLAANVDLHLPWVDTAHQAADFLSRWRP